MFIERLDFRQQGALLSIAEQLIKADGNISGQETVLLKTLRSQMASDVTPLQISVSDLSEIFTSNPAKASFLLELLGLAYADVEYHVTEKDFISNVASALCVSETTLADMESWVCRQFALVREAEQFMEG